MTLTKKSPYGGCTQPVKDCQMPCGHPCSIKFCHYSGGHINIPCNFLVEKTLDCGHMIEGLCSATEICYHPCERTLDCGHRCDLRCGEDCQTECSAMVETQIVECGHKITIPCWQTSLMSDRNLRENCKVIVEIPFPDCGHTVEVECRLCIGDCCTEICEKETNCGHRCNVKCGRMLLCQHVCPGLCHDCHQSRLHVECQEPCLKQLICGHLCNGNCGHNCPPCDHPCENQCLHVSHTCSQPCIECLELCLWECQHKKCDKLCYEECDICYENCTKNLECGHKCIGYCGDTCPPFCLTCDRNRFNQLYGNEEINFNQLDSIRLVQLQVVQTTDVDCLHIAESQALMTYLSNNERTIKRCPKCELVITGCHPFKNLIQQNFAYIADTNRRYFCLVDDNLERQWPLYKDVLQTAQKSRTYNFVGNFINKIMDNLQTQTNSKLKNTNLKILSQYQINIIENQVIAIEALSPILRQMQNNIETIDGLRRKFLLHFKDKCIPRFVERVRKFLRFLDEIFVNAEQQIFDIKNEINFFFKFCKVLNYLIPNHFHENCEEVLELLATFLSTSGGLTEEDVRMNRIGDLLPEVNGLLDDIEVNLKPNKPMNVLDNQHSLS